MRSMVIQVCGEVPPALAGLLVLAVLALASSSRQYAAVWHDEPTLWAYAVRLAPHKPRAINNYAVGLVLQKRFTEARVWFERAHQAGHSPHLPKWDRVEGEATARANLKALDALMAAVQ